MITVKSVLRAGKHNARVLLSNERIGRIPVSALADTFVELDFVEDSGILVHSSLKKPHRVPKQLPVVRDMSSFEPTEELQLIRTLVLKNHTVFGRRLTQMEVDDLSQDIFTHFWERGYFSAHDPSRSNYAGFINVGVRRYMIDRVRSKSYQTNTYASSLQFRVGDGDDSAEIQDFLPDDKTTPQPMKVELIDFIKYLRRYAEGYSNTHFTGTEVSFLDIFDSLFVTRDFETFCSRTPVSKRSVVKFKTQLVDYLRPYYQSWYGVA